MKVWAAVGALFALLIILPALAIEFAGGWIKLAGQIVLSLVFALIAAACLLFSYICVRAKAGKWGAGLLVLAIIFIFGVYAIWAGVPFL